jgi:DNA-directed RNA polymerase specialized sigma24 family protein
MTQPTATAQGSLIPPQPLPAGAVEFSRQVHGLLDGRPKDEATVAQAFEGLEPMFDVIAAGLYSLASMLVGEGEDSIGLVETAVARADVSVCHDPREARQNSRRVLTGAALEILEQRSPGCLAAPEEMAPSGACIEDDDLDAGVSHDELESMIAGPDRERVRNWLESLPTALRTVFVLRAVAGFTAPGTAALLAAHGGPKAAGWTPEAVSKVFRQGLCSLASQLLQASNAR